MQMCNESLRETCVLGWGSLLFLGNNLQGAKKHFNLVAAQRQGRI